LSDIVLIIVGLALLFAGGETLVRGATRLALALRLSTLMISAVIVGFGTSTPELLVSVRAALADTPGIALGNVIGSNIANILLIGGVAMISSSIVLPKSQIRHDVLWMLGSAVVIVGALQGDILGRIAGAGLVGLLVLYIVMSLRRGTNADTVDIPVQPKGIWLSVAFVIGGLAALFLGAETLVRGATAIARALGVSEAVIGLTIVAVGTSLPELATTTVAAIRRQGEVAIGNILGSNVFNILAVLGLTAVVTPIPLAGALNIKDALIMLAVTIFFAILLLAGMRLRPVIGMVFLAAYIAYIGMLFA
jgi:cation:H+ antiporter